jgi:hypothetical protein
MTGPVLLVGSGGGTCFGKWCGLPDDHPAWRRPTLTVTLAPHVGSLPMPAEGAARLPHKVPALEPDAALHAITATPAKGF